MEIGTSKNVGFDCRAPGFPFVTAFAAAVFGIGKSPLSALKFDEILWWLHHKTLLETGINVSSCPILREKCYIWDLVQVLTFVGSNGAFMAERRGTLTPDGYVLVNHHVIRVPSEIRKSCFDLSTFTLSTFIFVWLSSIWQFYGRRSPLAPKANENIVQGSDAPECRVQTKSGEETLLPVESTRDTGSTNDQCRQFTPRLTVKRSTLNFSSPSIGGDDDDHDGRATPSVALQAESSRRVIVFQHGLLESSLSWVYPLWNPICPSEVLHVQQRLWNILFFPITLVLSFTRYLYRQWTCLLPAPTTECSFVRIANCVPMNVMRLDNSLDVWLTNTRGNDFSAAINENDQQKKATPIGYSPVAFKTFSRIFSTYIDEQWTYVDSAVLDTEAFYTMLCSYYKTTRLKITVVGFSQGCAVLSLNAALKTWCWESRKKKSHRKLALSELESPPLFPVVQMNYPGTSDEVSRMDNLNTPLAIFTPQVDDDSIGSWNGEMSSGIYSNQEFEGLISDHQKGVCGGLVHCDICSMKPEKMLLICPPLRLRQLEGGILSGLLGGDSQFGGIAWFHLDYVVAVIELIQNMLSMSVIGLLGQLFVRYVMGFTRRPIHARVANLAYRHTPSGVTTRANMNLWKVQMLRNVTIGHVLPILGATRSYLTRIWKTQLIPQSIDLAEYLEKTDMALSIYATANDNIADTLKSAECIVRASPDVRVNVIHDEDAVISSHRDSSKTKITILTDGSHLDVIWSAVGAVRALELIASDIVHSFT